MARCSVLLAIALCLVAMTLAHPFEQQTAFEVKERHDFFNPRNSNPFSSAADAHMKTQEARLTHDFIGGKNWEADAYVAHQRQNMFGQTRNNNEGGLRFNMRF